MKAESRAFQTTKQVIIYKRNFTSKTSHATVLVKWTLHFYVEATDMNCSLPTDICVKEYVEKENILPQRPGNPMTSSPATSSCRCAIFERQNSFSNILRTFAWNSGFVLGVTVVSNNDKNLIRLLKKLKVHSILSVLSERVHQFWRNCFFLF